jgi:flagellar hook assembly protein FlgD
MGNYDTLINLQNNTNQVQYEASRKNLGSGKLDREGFIRLIMAQLQYQDPTEPKGNAEMLSQQLQLEQADQMKEVVNATKFAQAGSMVGQQATLMDARWDFKTNTTGSPEFDFETNMPKTVTGIIDAVQFDTQLGKALVRINGNYYDSQSIQQLSVITPPSSQTP